MSGLFLSPDVRFVLLRHFVSDYVLLSATRAALPDVMKELV